MIEDDNEIVFPSAIEIFRRGSPSWRVDILARRNDLLLERMAAHGNFVCPHVSRRNCYDVQEAGFVEETAERKGERVRAESGHKDERIYVHFGVHSSRTKLPSSLDRVTEVGFLGSSSRFSAFLFALCRGAKGKHLSFPNHRSAGKSNGH